jgi:hypothetical protein
MVSLGACIKPFDPKIDANSVNKFVVDGGVTSLEGYQIVKVSKASSVDQAKYIPVNGCDIDIIDDLGQHFALTQYEDGAYRVWMNASDLIPGRAYMLKVLTSSGEVLESLFDTMPNGPEDVGDVYMEITDIQTNDPEIQLHGIQFYTDFIADEMDSRYHRWKLTETWEYHAEYALEYYYDWTGLHQVSPPDSSQMVCWNTVVVNDIYTLSTVNLSENSLDRYPLNYVRNTTDKLKILYSLLIEQSALSEDAYLYWDKLRININQEGGLYTSQPIAIKGNVFNTSDPENEVLGFFQASTFATKRIFVWPLDDLELDIESRCNIDPLRFGYLEIPQSEYPAFIFSDSGNPSFSTMTNNCVLCPTAGGVTIKPDYWPL